MIPFLGYASRRGNAVSKSVSEAMFNALFALVSADGWPAVKRRIDVGKSTASRWQIAFESGDRPGFNRDSFDELMKLEEVRSAAASAALQEPETDAAAWRAIGGALADLMSPDAAWTLVRKLRRMRELGLLDPKFPLLQGVIDQRSNAVDPSAEVRNMPKTKANRES